MHLFWSIVSLFFFSFLLLLFLWIFKKEPGTTSPTAPFGLVTIPDSGTEGGADVGAFRIAQTGSFGSSFQSCL